MPRKFSITDKKSFSITDRDRKFSITDTKP